MTTWSAPPEPVFVTVIAYAMVMTWVILKVLDAVIGLRVGEAEERLGLDASQHGELAYQL